ncbi:MAG: response regulator [Steroidobacteraceae bacterium]
MPLDGRRLRRHQRIRPRLVLLVHARARAGRCAAVEHPTGRHPVLALLDGTASNRRRNVLLVEDNPVNQEVARSLLELLQCDCTIADNGARAVELLVDEHEFDVVLMDCQMPEMDGFEATRRVRTNEAQGGGHVPIVALTANAMVGDRELCLAAGMDDFLSKPFRRDELAAMIERWGGRRQRAGAAQESAPLAGARRTG